MTAGKKEEKYRELFPVLKSLITAEENQLSNLANFSALLKENFPVISWVGFYLFDGTELYLGPFQGRTACTRIKLGKGVCGTAAEKRETLIVEDVHKFEGHIACDAGSNSEIVVPVVKQDALFGVLDLDSYDFSAFDEIDKNYLEQYVNYLAEVAI